MGVDNARYIGADLSDLFGFVDLVHFVVCIVYILRGNQATMHTHAKLILLQIDVGSAEDNSIN